MKMVYKRIKKTVPYCEKCEKEILGNGSIMFPYWCACGEWSYDATKNDYILISNEEKPYERSSL